MRVEKDFENNLDPNPAWGMREDPSGEVHIAVDASTMPPERVRFTAPMVIRPEGGTDVDGAVLNLSTRGVAVCAPWEGKTGARVWIQFRLSLGEEPLSLLCEVIWCRPHSDDDFSLGLRFASLTREEERRVRAVVTERSEGRAGEWPLPMMPEEQQPSALGRVRQANPYLTAGAGMAAGIALALVFSVIPRSEPPAVAVNGGVKIEAPAEAAEPSTMVVVAPKPEVAPEPVAPPPEPEPEPVAQVEQDDLLPRRVSEPVKKSSSDVLRPLGTNQGVELALLLDGPADDHVSFWLDGPRRLVVDVFGRRSGFSRKSYDVEHPLVSRVRVGQHAGKVRFVIETSEKVDTRVQARTAGDSLLVELQRKSS